MSIAVVTALAMVGCSPGDAEAPPDADTPSDGRSEQSESAASPSATDFPTLPVGDVFGDAQWGVQAAVTKGLAAAPVVTRDRLVVLSGSEVHAYDAAGGQAWTANTEMLRDGLQDPFLRRVSDEVVALVSQGKSTGEGLDADVYSVRVLLLSIESGEEIATVDVPGIESDDPDVSRYGLAFIHPDGHALVISADGTTEEIAEDEAGVPSESSSGDATDQMVTIGDIVLVRAEDGTYRTETWDTTSISPIDLVSATDISGVIGTDALVVRWYSGIGAQGTESGAVVDAHSGEVLASIDDCIPNIGDVFTTSPSGEYAVYDSVRWDGSDATCIGGGDGQRATSLTAVSDDGTAYGRAEGDLLVVVPASGEAGTSDLGQAEPPIGIMDGGLAIHLDAHSGIITANPIED